MEIQVIEKTIVQKWMKDDKHGFEVSLEDIWQFISFIIDHCRVSKSEIEAMTDDLMFSYFIENEILMEADEEYEPGVNFEEFSDLIYDKLCN